MDELDVLRMHNETLKQTVDVCRAETAELAEKCARMEEALEALGHERNRLARVSVDARDDFHALREEYWEHRRTCSVERTGRISTIVRREQRIKDLETELRLLRKELAHQC